MIRFHAALMVVLFVIAPAGADDFHGAQVAVLKGHTAPILYFAFSPDGKTLVSSAVDQDYDRTAKAVTTKNIEAKIWDLTANKERAADLLGTVYALAFAPDSSTFAVGGSVLAPRKTADGKPSSAADLKLRDAAGKLIADLPGHMQTVRAVAFSPDGKTLASLGHDQKLILWDVAGRRQRTVLSSGVGTALAFSTDGKLLACNCGSAIKFWDPDAGKEIKQIKMVEFKDRKSTGGSCIAMALAPDGKTLATVNQPLPDFTSDAPPPKAKDISLWDVDSGKIRAVLVGHEQRISSIAFVPGGKLLASAGDDGSAKLWDLTTGKLAASVMDGETGEVRYVAFSPDGKRLATGSYNGRIILWDTAKVLGLKTGP